MEKGLMRVEVNVSVSQGKKLGTKVEIKNLNSFRVVEKAIDFEIARQTELLESGQKVIQETRGWHDKKEITFSQREKEEAHDYRYFPEPDLPPIHLDQGYLDRVAASIPELPAAKRLRLGNEYGLDTSSVEMLTRNKDLGEYFEKAASELDEWIDQKDDAELKRAVKIAANYLLSDVLGILKEAAFVETEFKVTPENFAEFIAMIHRGEISSKIAKMLLVEMINTGGDPSSIVDGNQWRQVSDDSQLEGVIAKVVAANEKAAQDYRAGNRNALQFLAGQVMKETRGTADPKKLQFLLEKLLQ
jgi:aspartyl-tRNA(Asn)/glutamyl-tRNA(Gln) amidotransferase subunit B